MVRVIRVIRVSVIRVIRVMIRVIMCRVMIDLCEGHASMHQHQHLDKHYT